MRRKRIRGYELSGDLFIGGERVRASQIARYQPSHLDPDTQIDISMAGRYEAGIALDAANSALPKWSSMESSERGQFLLRLATAISFNVYALTAIEAISSPFSEEQLHLKVIPELASAFRAFGEVMQSSRKVESLPPFLNEVIYAPVGQVVVFLSSLTPLTEIGEICAPALAAGNTVVLRTDVSAPLATSLFMDLVSLCDFPPGVINWVSGSSESLDNALVASKLTSRVIVNGSRREAARLVAVGAASQKLSLHRNPYAPLIALIDASVEVDRIAYELAQLFNIPQRAMNKPGVRLLAHSDIATQLSEALKSHVLAARKKYASRAALNSRLRVQKFANLCEYALDDGDQLVFGGRHSEESELWFEPTLILISGATSRLYVEDFSSPLMTIESYRDFEWVRNRLIGSSECDTLIAFTTESSELETLIRTIPQSRIYVNQLPPVSTASIAYRVEADLESAADRSFKIQSFAQRKDIRAFLPERY